MDRRILIVDDDENLREELAELLRTEGFEVVEAGDGAAALDSLRSGTLPRVILLDLMMPVMDGWEFRREIQQDPALSKIPIVVMTAAGQRGTNFADIGEVLHKPFDFDALLDAVSPFR